MFLFKVTKRKEWYIAKATLLEVAFDSEPGTHN